MRCAEAHVSKTLIRNEWGGMRQEGIWYVTPLVYGACCGSGTGGGRQPNPHRARDRLRRDSRVARATTLIATLAAAVVNCAVRLQAPLAGMSPAVHALSRGTAALLPVPLVA